MNAQVFRTASLAARVFLAVLPMLANMAAAAEAGPEITAKAPARRVVLRVSPETLKSLLGNNDVDRQMDVRDTILGTSVYGKLRLVGKPSITLVDSAERAVFNLHFRGTTFSRTTGYNGPAIIYNRTVTTFSATRQIVFEPGKGFYGLPPRVTARTQVFLEGIGSTRGGLIGRIVRRRATTLEAARHDTATEIARQRSERRIEAGFLRNTDQRLAQLNSLATFRALAATAPGSTKGDAPKFSFSTTPHCLQIVATFGDGNPAYDLPTFDSSNLAMAPVELWIHNSLVSDPVVAALGLLDSQVGVGTWLEIAANSVLPGSKVDADKLGALLAEQQVRVRKANDWQVIAFEKPTERSPAVPPAGAVVALKPVLPSVSASPPAAAAAKATAPPAPALSRLWTSGAHTAHAEFLALEGNVVRLRRVTGITTRIPLEKLSAIDQQWIANYLARR